MTAPFEIPGYEILAKIGEGGMATVWKARQLSLDREVALKIFTLGDNPNADDLQRFRLEAQAVARFHHPGIIGIYDAGEHQGIVYSAMEYVPGQTVAQLITRDRQLAEPLALTIAKGVAAALRDAWEAARLVHCDIKPDNILLDPHGAVKLADLGLARVRGLGGARADQEMIVGTPQYLSPEQARGEPDLDCRTDMYALGATLYHMVTGRVPFGTGGDYQKIMDAQLRGYLPDPLDLNPSLSSGLAWLIEKLMIKARNQRPARWADVVVDLEAVARGEFPRAPLPIPAQSTIARSAKRLAPGAGAVNLKAVLAAVEQKAVAQTAQAPGRPAAAAVPATPRPPPAPSPAAAPVPVPAAGKTATPTPGAGTQAAPRKQLRIGTPHATSRPGSHLARNRHTAASATGVTFWICLLLAAGAGYWGYRYYTTKVQPAEKAKAAEALRATLPPRTTVATPAAASAAPPTAAPAPAAKPDAAKPNPQTPAPAKPHAAERGIRWQNPTFLRGAQLYNSALEQYLVFQATRTNQPALQTIQQQAREAITAFETCRAGAPAEVRIPDLIAQCHHLIADCRHSTLLAGAAGGEQPVTGAPMPEAAPAPTTALRRIVIQPIEPQEAEASLLSKDGLTLAPTWNELQPLADPVPLSALRRLLRPYGQPQLSTGPDATIHLPGRIPYLLPAEEAARRLGLALGTRNDVTLPAFPLNSFSYYEQPLPANGGRNRLLLLADPQSRVIGLQYEWDQPEAGGERLPAETFAPEYRLYNLLRDKGRSVETDQVGLQVMQNGGLVRIDSELKNAAGQPLRRVRLVLARPVVDLMLLRLQTLKPLLDPKPAAPPPAAAPPASARKKKPADAEDEAAQETT